MGTAKAHAEVGSVLQTRARRRLGALPSKERHFASDSRLNRLKRKYVRPRAKHPRGMHDLSFSDEEGGSKRLKTTGPGYRSELGDWQFGKCEFWNRKWWGTCHEETCNGTQVDNAVAVHELVFIS